MWLILTGVNGAGKTSLLRHYATTLRRKGYHTIYAHCDVWPYHSPFAYEQIVPLAMSPNWLVLQDRCWIDEWVYHQLEDRPPHFDPTLVEWWLGRLVAVGATGVIATRSYNPTEQTDRCADLYREWARRYPYWRVCDEPLSEELIAGWIEETRMKQYRWSAGNYFGPQTPELVVVGTELESTFVRYAPALYSRPELREVVPPERWPSTLWVSGVGHLESVLGDCEVRLRSTGYYTTIMEVIRHGKEI
ncbi:ATP-binding protein [Thermogutta sp.]|uniref:ATP-binding protein n=1 Tax=Thermogutta sp. TaxID=1962930 RepID=UPI00321F87F0